MAAAKQVGFGWLLKTDCAYWLSLLPFWVGIGAGDSLGIPARVILVASWSSGWIWVLEGFSRFMVDHDVDGRSWPDWWLHSFEFQC